MAAALGETHWPIAAAVEAQSKNAMTELRIRLSWQLGSEPILRRWHSWLAAGPMARSGYPHRSHGYSGTAARARHNVLKVGYRHS